MCCSVLQCVALCEGNQFGEMSEEGVYIYMLHCDAVGCSVLQYVRAIGWVASVRMCICIAVCCSVL